MDLPANIAAALMEAIIPQRTCLLKVDNDRLVDKRGIFSSARGSYSHPDLLVIQHQPHFFRSHLSSTPDFHFLSHYSYIKAIMLYKGKTWQDSGILWNTLAYSGILWHTLAYSLAYSGTLWHTLAYSSMLWHTVA